MKKTWIYLLAIVLVVLAATLLYNALSDRMQSDRLSSEGGFVPSVTTTGKDDEKKDDKDQVMIPDFTVTDYEGESYAITDFFGKPVVINFWASWCPPCVGEMPEFHNVYKEYGEDIHFLMINVTDGVRETKEDGKNFITKNGYTFPVYYDIDLVASLGLGVYSYPTTLFLDKEGYVITGAIGAIDEELIKKGIGMIQ